MLQAMRENTKVILWITVIFFLLLIFLVWGADLQLGGGTQPNVMGTVNGTPISYGEFQTVYQQNRQGAAARGRDLQPSELVAIEERTWNDLIDNALLQKEAQRLNLEAQDSEIRSVMLNSPPAIFQRAFVDSLGRFDFQSYRQYILSPATPDRELVAMESYIRANLPIQKLQQLIIAGATVSEKEVRRTFLDQNEEVEVSYILVPSPAVNNVPDDAALEAHFQSTQEDYALPRRADLLYVTFPRVATARDSADIVTELNEFAEEARQAATSTDENVALQYSDFETLVMTFSDGPNADGGGLSVGFLAPEEMTPAIASAVEGLAADEISAPFLDAGMYHIIQVVDEKVEDDRRLVQIRDLARKVAPSDSTIQALREQVDNLRKESLAQGLEAAAQEAGFSVRQVADVTEAGFVPGLSLIPGIGYWAVTHNSGDLSRVYPSNEGWHLVEIAETKDPGYPTFDAVKNQVRTALVAEQRLSAARARADQLMGQVKLGKTLEEAATADGLAVQQSPSFTRQSGMPGIPRNPEVVAAAFSGAVGEVLKPVKSSRGWVILQVEVKMSVDETLYETQGPGIRNSLMGLQQVTIFNAYLETLRDRAKIEDFRS